MLLSIENVSKSFFGTKVLDDVHFDLYPGEVHVLIGENGAGKSTLLKIISGMYDAEQGTMYINGKPVPLSDPSRAKKVGISAIYQDLILVPDMTIAENVFLGHQPRLWAGWVNFKRMKRQTKVLLKELGSTLNPDTTVRDLSLADKYMVSIARAMSQPFRILIMDEPTASLTPQEREILFERIHWLKAQGIGIIYTTHRLDELSEVADRVTVLRDGKRMLTMAMKDTSERELVNVMVGRDIGTYFPPKLTGGDKELLRVESLTKVPLFHDVNFSLYEGEILGIAGLVGSGKTDLAKTLFGEMRKQSGQLYWMGKEVNVPNPHSAVKQGFGFVDDNRLENGLVLEMSTVKNMTMTIADKLTSMEFIHPNREREAALDKMIELDIKLSDPDREVKYLSGGNQQKVLLGKWLVQDSDLYILNEPTKGIDVGARVDLYLVIHELARHGKGMIIVSSDLSELQGLCSRVLVMENGCLKEESV